MEDIFYTVEEIAKTMRVNSRTIIKLIRKKKLLAVNVGTQERAHWRIYEGQYKKFLAENYEQNKGE